MLTEGPDPGLADALMATGAMSASQEASSATTTVAAMAKSAAKPKEDFMVMVIDIKLLYEEAVTSVGAKCRVNGCVLRKYLQKEDLHQRGRDVQTLYFHNFQGDLDKVDLIAQDVSPCCR